MSKAVKDIDPNAEIFGPALFGYGAFTNFADAPDWKEIKNDNPEYKWFIDYYLDEMKKAEDENGRRLLDVLDVHFTPRQRAPAESATASIMAIPTVFTIS